MVEETRKARLDMFARIKFTAEGEPIHETRLLLAEDFEETQQVSQFHDLAADGLIEMEAG